MRRVVCALALAIVASYVIVVKAQVTCSPSNYTGLSNTAPIPLNFCPYTEIPHRNRLPPSPAHIDTTQTANLVALYDYWESHGYPNGDPDARVLGVVGKIDKDNTGGNGGDCPGVDANECNGDSGYSIWVATNSDPLVTVRCANVTYGCSNNITGNDNAPDCVTSPSDPSCIPAFRVPANARPSYNPELRFGDRNWQVIQPDGKSFAMYGCWPSRDFQNGDVLNANSGGPCQTLAGLQGLNYADIVTGDGINPGNINGGDDFISTIVTWREVEAGQINHAMSVLLTCGSSTVVYPGAGAGTCSDLGIGTNGIPWGSRIWLDLTHAQIDDLITAGGQPAHMRPFLYAAHDYGVFVFDGGGGKGMNQPWLENTTAIVINGATNPWANWFAAQGWGIAGDGQYKRGDGIDWFDLKNNLHVLDVCYSHGTCSDSGQGSETSPPPDAATGSITTSDTFTGSAGTALTAHTGETGATWTLRTGSSAGWVITDANKIRLNAGGVDTYTCASGPPLSAQYDVNLSWTVQTRPSDRFYVIALKATTTAATDLRLTYDSGGTQWYLEKVTAGVGTSLGTIAQTLNAGNTYSINIRARTGQLGVFVDSTRIIYSTDTTFGATVGKVCLGGFSSSTADTNSTGIHFDTLVVQDEETQATGVANTTFPPGILIRNP